MRGLVLELSQVLSAAANPAAADRGGGSDPDTCAFLQCFDCHEIGEGPVNLIGPHHCAVDRPAGQTDRDNLPPRPRMYSDTPTDIPDAAQTRLTGRHATLVSDLDQGPGLTAGLGLWHAGRSDTGTTCHPTFEGYDPAAKNDDTTKTAI